MVGLLPLVAVTTLGPATMARAARLQRARRVVHRATGREGARGRRSTWSRRSTPAGGCSRSSTRSGCAACSRRMLDRERVPLADYGLRALSRYHARPSARRRRRTASTATLDYEPARVDERPLRRQLELARPDLVPDQLPARSRRSASTTATSATTSRSSSRPAPAASVDARRRSPTSSARRLTRDLPRRRGRPPPVFGGYAAASRTIPTWHDLHPVPRVLPRRHRRRPRRLAPDRLDRARRRPDHPPRPLKGYVDRNQSVLLSRTDWFLFMEPVVMIEPR